MLVESKPIIAELVDQFPRVEMLSIGADCNLWFKMAPGERIGQFGARLQMVELLTIGQEIEHKYFHGCVPLSVTDSVRGRSGRGQSDPAAPIAFPVRRTKLRGSTFQRGRKQWVTKSPSWAQAR